MKSTPMWVRSGIASNIAVLILMLCGISCNNDDDENTRSGGERGGASPSGIKGRRGCKIVDVVTQPLEDPEYTRLYVFRAVKRSEESDAIKIFYTHSVGMAPSFSASFCVRKQNGSECYSLAEKLLVAYEEAKREDTPKRAQEGDERGEAETYNIDQIAHPDVKELFERILTLIKPRIHDSDSIAGKFRAFANGKTKSHDEDEGSYTPNGESDIDCASTSDTGTSCEELCHVGVEGTYTIGERKGDGHEKSIFSDFSSDDESKRESSGVTDESSSSRRQSSDASRHEGSIGDAISDAGKGADIPSGNNVFTEIEDGQNGKKNLMLAQATEEGCESDSADAAPSTEESSSTATVVPVDFGKEGGGVESSEETGEATPEGAKARRSIHTDRVIEEEKSEDVTALDKDVPSDAEKEHTASGKETLENEANVTIMDPVASTSTGDHLEQIGNNHHVDVTPTHDGSGSPVLLGDADQLSRPVVPSTAMNEGAVTEGPSETEGEGNSQASTTTSKTNSDEESGKDKAAEPAAVASTATSGVCESDESEATSLSGVAETTTGYGGSSSAVIASSDECHLAEKHDSLGKRKKQARMRPLTIDNTTDAESRGTSTDVSCGEHRSDDEENPDSFLETCSPGGSPLSHNKRYRFTFPITSDDEEGDPEILEGLILTCGEQTKPSETHGLAVTRKTEEDSVAAYEEPRASKTMRKREIFRSRSFPDLCGKYESEARMVSRKSIDSQGPEESVDDSEAGGRHNWSLSSQSSESFICVPTLYWDNDSQMSSESIPFSLKRGKRISSQSSSPDILEPSLQALRDNNGNGEMEEMGVGQYYGHLFGTVQGETSANNSKYAEKESQTSEPEAEEPGSVTAGYPGVSLENFENSYLKEPRTFEYLSAPHSPDTMVRGEKTGENSSFVIHSLEHNLPASNSPVSVGIEPVSVSEIQPVEGNGEESSIPATLPSKVRRVRSVGSLPDREVDEGGSGGSGITGEDKSPESHIPRRTRSLVFSEETGFGLPFHSGPAIKGLREEPGLSYGSFGRTDGQGAEKGWTAFGDINQGEKEDTQHGNDLVNGDNQSSGSMSHSSSDDSVETVKEMPIGARRLRFSSSRPSAYSGNPPESKILTKGKFFPPYHTRNPSVPLAQDWTEQGSGRIRGGFSAGNPAGRNLVQRPFRTSTHSNTPHSESYGSSIGSKYPRINTSRPSHETHMCTGRRAKGYSFTSYHEEVFSSSATPQLQTEFDPVFLQNRNSDHDSPQPLSATGTGLHDHTNGAQDTASVWPPKVRRLDGTVPSVYVHTKKVITEKQNDNGGHSTTTTTDTVHVPLSSNPAVGSPEKVSEDVVRELFRDPGHVTGNKYGGASGAEVHDTGKGDYGSQGHPGNDGRNADGGRGYYGDGSQGCGPQQPQNTDSQVYVPKGGYGCYQDGDTTPFLSGGGGGRGSGGKPPKYPRVYPPTNSYRYARGKASRAPSTGGASSEESGYDASEDSTPDYVRSFFVQQEKLREQYHRNHKGNLPLNTNNRAHGNTRIADKPALTGRTPRGRQHVPEDLRTSPEPAAENQHKSEKLVLGVFPVNTVAMSMFFASTVVSIVLAVSM